MTPRVLLKQRGRYVFHTELPRLLRNGWQESYDSEAEVSYYFSPDGRDVVTMDSEQSLDLKIVWVFRCDLFPPAKGERYPTPIDR